MIEANVRLVRDLIAANPEQFDMSRFGDETTLTPPSLNKCGTAGCIAGWAASLAGDPIPEVTEPIQGDWSERYKQINDANRAIITSACKFLGFEPATFDENSYGIPQQGIPAELFFITQQSWIDDHLSYITSFDAGATLDHFLATGEVVWPDISERIDTDGYA